MNKEFQDWLECTLTVVELRDYSKKLAEETQKKSRLEEQKKTTVSEFAAKINGCTAEVNKLALAVATGKESRMVKCETEFHTPAQGEKTIRRLDTGEIVRITLMSRDELDDLFNEQKKESDGESDGNAGDPGVNPENPESESDGKSDVSPEPGGGKNNVAPVNGTNPPGDKGVTFLFRNWKSIRIIDYAAIEDQESFAEIYNFLTGEKTEEELAAFPVDAPTGLCLVVRDGKKYLLCEEKNPPETEAEADVDVVAELNAGTELKVDTLSLNDTPPVCGAKHKDGIRACYLDLGHVGNHRYRKSA